MSEETLFEVDRFSLLAYWPDMYQEVCLREKELESFYRIIERLRQVDLENMDEYMLKNIYATFINQTNMAATHYMQNNQTISTKLREIFDEV